MLPFSFIIREGTFNGTGFPSNEGSCNDIDKVYEKVKETYESANIWVTSSCGGHWLQQPI